MYPAPPVTRTCCIVVFTPSVCRIHSDIVNQKIARKGCRLVGLAREAPAHREIEQQAHRAVQISRRRRKGRPLAVEIPCDILFRPQHAVAMKRRTMSGTVIVNVVIFGVFFSLL